MLLISDAPSGELLLGDKTMKELEEEKLRFNKLKLLEAMKKTQLSVEEIVNVQPMVEECYKEVRYLVMEKKDGSEIL